MCFFFKKNKIEECFEYELDCTQWNGIYKRTLTQWRIKHKLD